MKIFVTGSTTGLGQLAGQLLMKQGHEVVLHARSKDSSMKDKAPYVVGDLSKLDELKSVTEQANEHGTFDAVIHNAGVYTSPPEELFMVNVLAPYILTTKMNKPKRLIYLSSGMSQSGTFTLDPKRMNYSDTKLLVFMMAKYFGRHWNGVYSNAVNPGWVPTRMGGTGAPDDLMKGAETQVWLATSTEPQALVTGKYFFHKKEQPYNPLADSEADQDKLISFLSKF